MSKKVKPSQERDKETDKKKPDIELRSDAVRLLQPKTRDTKIFMVLILAVAGGVLIGGGVFAAMKYFGMWAPASSQSRQYNFGSLPMGEGRENEFETPPTPQVTGRYNGMPCADPNRRAIAVMLAGDPVNRPVSGFAKADMVWELPVLVSDVTRLLAVYQCGQPGDIGSVRSARHDYLFLAEGLDAILGHWGGSYHALNRIRAGEFQTINALSNPYGAYFRKSHLPAPYNGFTTYEALWSALQKLGYRTMTEWNGLEFQDDAPLEARPAGGKLSVAWPGQFRVHYEYDRQTNRYQRFWAGSKQVDGEDGTPVAPSSIAVMRATNQFAEGPGGYNDVGIEGEGQLVVYQDGKAIPGKWRKDERYKNDPVHFMNEKGEPVRFTRGQIWVMAVEPNIEVAWQPK